MTNNLRSLAVFSYRPFFILLTVFETPRYSFKFDIKTENTCIHWCVRRWEDKTFINRGETSEYWTNSIYSWWKVMVIPSTVFWSFPSTKSNYNQDLFMNREIIYKNFLTEKFNSAFGEERASGLYVTLMMFLTKRPYKIVVWD